MARKDCVNINYYLFVTLNTYIVHKYVFAVYFHAYNKILFNAPIHCLGNVS